MNILFLYLDSVYTISTAKYFNKLATDAKRKTSEKVYLN